MESKTNAGEHSGHDIGIVQIGRKGKARPVGVGPMLVFASTGLKRQQQVPAWNEGPPQFRECNVE